MLRATAVASLFALALPAFADHEVHHPFHATVPAAAIRSVLIAIPAGEVVVRNSTDGALTITGDVQRQCDGIKELDRQQAMVDDIEAAIYVAGDQAVIERKFGPHAGSWAARSFRTAFRVQIEVPPGVNIELGTRYGEVAIDGTFGDVAADLRAGEIRLRMPRALVKNLEASVRVGDLDADYGGQRVSNEGVFPRATRYQNAAGRSDVTLHVTAGEVRITLTP